MGEEQVVEEVKSEYSVGKTFQKAGLDLAVVAGLAVGSYLLEPGTLEALFKAVPPQFAVAGMFLVRALLGAGLNYLKNRSK